jgi:alkylation response protein AidB-like acyl-CoA dehydrogenase
MTKLNIGPDSTVDEVASAVRDWVADEVPRAWREAAKQGPEAVKRIRSPEQYRAWYPIFGRSGLVAATWEPQFGGLGVSREAATAIEDLLRPYRLYRLNPLGLNNAAAALFAHGTLEQQRRFLPPIVTNEERWCQLFSEPGAGSDLASLATRAERAGDEWVVTGQKVWTTWAEQSEFAMVLARTDPTRPKHRGLTYFLLDMRQPAVEVRPLRQITGEAEFNEVFLDGARIPDAYRLGPEGEGWRVSAATLSSERQMVAGSGSGGIGRLGGVGADRLITVARQRGRWADSSVRDAVMRLWVEEQVRGLTNARVLAARAAGEAPGPAASIGKVHQASLNQRIQQTLVDLIGAQALAWAPDTGSDMPSEVRGMLRSLANSIEGGTTEVNKNVLGERVLGLPREPDPWHGRPWNEVPRS